MQALHKRYQHFVTPFAVYNKLDHVLLMRINETEVWAAR